MQLKSIQSILITRAVNAITFYKIDVSFYYENQKGKEMNQYPLPQQCVTITILPSTAKQAAVQVKDPETSAKEPASHKKNFSLKIKLLPSVPVQVS